MYAVLLLAIFSMASFMGCAGTDPGNDGQLQSYPVPKVEAGWIRNGDSLLFEGNQWFPVDDVESLMDSEVYQIGEYQDVQIFVEKIDAKPYDRLYTKFAKNKYRYFERSEND